MIRFFFLGNNTKEMGLSIEMLFRYSLDAVQVMRKMILVWEFDGNCDDNGINFYTNDDDSNEEERLSLEQKRFILQTELPNRYFNNGATTGPKNVVLEGVIARYFEWKRARLPLLVQCLTAFHETLFRSSNPYVYRGIWYVRCHHTMKMLLWCYAQSRQHGIQETENNTIIILNATTTKESKISNTVHIIWDLFKTMKEHGIKLQREFRVVEQLHRSVSAETYKTLYKKFRDENFQAFPSKYAWKRMNESLLYAFSQLALQWWIPYKRFKLLKK